MIRSLIAIIALAFWTLPTDAHASIVVFQKELKFNTDVNNFDTNQVDFDLVFLDNPLSPTNKITLFDDLVITPADESPTGGDGSFINGCPDGGGAGDACFAVTSADPFFDEAVVRLQDGLNQNIQYILTEDEPGGLSEKRGGPESNFFTIGSPPNAPQLNEATIDKIVIRVDTFPQLASVGGGPGIPIEVILELSIVGTVPEPSTGWLLLLGTGTLGASHSRLWRRFRRT